MSCLILILCLMVPLVGCEGFQSQVALRASDASIKSRASMLNLPYVTVSAFGAVGDGAHDDTQSIQNAIAYAAANNLGVVFDWGTSGRYRTGEIDIRGSNVPKYIEGGGVTLLPLDNASYSNSALMYIENPQLLHPAGFSVMNLYFDGRDSGGKIVIDYGLYLHGGQKVAFSRIRGQYFLNSGISIVGESGFKIFNLFMEDIFAAYNGFSGMSLINKDPSGTVASYVDYVQILNAQGDTNGTWSNKAIGYGFYVNSAELNCFGCSAEGNINRGLYVENGLGYFQNSYFERNGSGPLGQNYGPDIPWFIDTVHMFTVDGKVNGDYDDLLVQPNVVTPSPFQKFSWADPLIYRSLGDSVLSVEVDDFGAIGNGVADDTKAIEAALAFASSRNLGVSFGANKVYLVDGLDLDLTADKYKNLKYIFGNGATLRGSSATEGRSLLFVSQSANMTSTNDFVVSDLNLNCYSHARWALHIYGTQYAHYRNLAAYNCSDHGVYVEGDVGYGVYYSIFDNIQSFNNGGSGMRWISDPQDLNNFYIASDSLLNISANGNWQNGIDMSRVSLRCDYCSASYNVGFGFVGYQTSYYDLIGSRLNANALGDYKFSESTITLVTKLAP